MGIKQVYPNDILLQHKECYISHKYTNYTSIRIFIFHHKSKEVKRKRTNIVIAIFFLLLQKINKMQ